MALQLIPNQVIEAKITDYKEDGHKISLSMKALIEDEESDDDADVADVDIEKVASELENEAAKEEE